MATSADQANAVLLADDHHPVAVVLDLVQPVGAGGHLVRLGGAPNRSALPAIACMIASPSETEGGHHPLGPGSPPSWGHFHSVDARAIGAARLGKRLVHDLTHILLLLHVERLVRCDVVHLHRRFVKQIEWSAMLLRSSRWPALRGRFFLRGAHPFQPWLSF
jgi:hypothetical protein